MKLDPVLASGTVVSGVEIEALGLKGGVVRIRRQGRGRKGEKKDFEDSGPASASAIVESSKKE